MNRMFVRSLLVLAFSIFAVACSAEGDPAAHAWELTYESEGDTTPLSINRLVGTAPRVRGGLVPVEDQDGPTHCTCSPPVEGDPSCQCNGELNCCISCCAGL